MFAGIGGFRVGLEASGHECVGSCEIDKYARQIYAKNFGHEPEWGDATKINPEELPDFSILCAGFPCQSFSICGGRQGFNDTRGTLFFEVVRIAKVKKPQILFLENVRGLLNHDGGKTFEVILNSMVELGYSPEWQLVNSKYYTPQNRERLYIIGHYGETSGRKILPLGKADEQYDETPMIKKVGKVHKGQSGEVYSTDGISTTILSGGGGDGAKTGLYLEPKLKQVGNIDHAGHNSIWGRVYDPKGISANLNAEGGGLGAKTGLYKEGARIRRLTPTECERLQGFKDGWTLGCSDTQRYRMLGNAVTTNVIKEIGGLF